MCLCVYVYLRVYVCERARMRTSLCLCMVLNPCKCKLCKSTSEWKITATLHKFLLLPPFLFSFLSKKKKTVKKKERRRLFGKNIRSSTLPYPAFSSLSLYPSSASLCSLNAISLFNFRVVKCQPFPLGKKTAPLYFQCSS